MIKTLKGRGVNRPRFNEIFCLRAVATIRALARDITFISVWQKVSTYGNNTAVLNYN